VEVVSRGGRRKGYEKGGPVAPNDGYCNAIVVPKSRLPFRHRTGRAHILSQSITPSSEIQPDDFAGLAPARARSEVHVPFYFHARGVPW
jgi:hypothetical protein